MNDSFYKENIILLNEVIKKIEKILDEIKEEKEINGERNPIKYTTTRIKTEKSMKEKLKRKKLDISLENALTKVYDAAGVRVICEYIDDVYSIVERIKQYNEIGIIKEKDYIKNPKPNGYRSYHIVCRVPINVKGKVYKTYVEIQIRTIAMDFWSSLEHQIKYKKNIKNQEIIVEELKRCADEIATTDINMLAIRNMINKN